MRGCVTSKQVHLIDLLDFNLQLELDETAATALVFPSLALELLTFQKESS
jgi:hypothetical protein